MESFINKSSQKTNISKKKFIRIPNPVPQYDITSDKKENIITCISRVDGSKMHHLIIEAFALLKHKHPDWTVEFWGDYTNNIKY